MGQDGLPKRGELAMVEKRRLVGHAPEFPRDELAVSREKSGGTCGLELVQRLGVGIARSRGDVVKLEVRERRDERDSLMLFKARPRQFRVVEVDGQRRRVPRSEVSGRVERAGLREFPALVLQ